MANTIGLNISNLQARNLQRYLPKPQNNGWETFNKIMKAAGSLGSSVLEGAASKVVGGDLSSLINQQMEMQMEMQQVSMVSNIERSEHETKMTPIRNIRLS